MTKEDILTFLKGIAPIVLLALQKATEWLPVWSLWVGAIYGTLHLYVFVRDRLPKPGRRDAR